VLTNSYHSILSDMNRRGYRLGDGMTAWLGNIMSNSGIDPNKKVCVEQAMYMGEQMKAQFPGLRAEILMLKPDAVHSVLRLTASNGEVYYADPWANVPPTSNLNNISYGSNGISSSFEL
jgi:hypothetical protein